LLSLILFALLLPSGEYVGRMDGLILMPFSCTFSLLKMSCFLSYLNDDVWRVCDFFK
jgi:hypothetical protein